MPILSGDGLERVLGYKFTHSSLLETALTHRSAGRNNNERLEFLGDGVLNFIVGALLFEHFPKASEGDLTRLRANLVNGTALAVLANKYRLGDYLHLGSGELKSGGFRRDSILAGALESVIGAVYLDGGFDACRILVHALYQEHMKTLSVEALLKDPKTRLQEYLQGLRLPLPEYTVLTMEGGTREESFIVECAVEGKGIKVQGSGTSRRKAEQEAASKVLELLTAEERSE